jgi:hypothetical protein
MLNLETLDLNLFVSWEKKFIDGNNLKSDIINHMSRLNNFTFNIRSQSEFYNQIELPSNTDIQHTFKDFKKNQIISCVDYFQDRKYSQCHMYSYPYQLKFYNNIANNFPGGLFKCVHEVSLYDEQPFEHEFFLRIAQSFPLLKDLTVVNQKPQKNKPYRKSENDNQNLSIIEYPHLTDLNLNEAHSDYAEQFLFDTKASLPDNVRLLIDYRHLIKVTHNCTRDATRINCSKIDCLYSYKISRLPKHFNDYFNTLVNIF